MDGHTKSLSLTPEAEIYGYVSVATSRNCCETECKMLPVNILQDVLLIG